ncbi:outer membrane protein assembly factor BamA [Blochmannia endosymbiont of Polyrhachis (Hedomyrma) turneri]|uniref:outer membrane protein assembly factor BamA n=1 Tax=Blochmannia endosymbiont of Polyrhachis (Hedomyrma) turneri TaxID=1505596 RepID=UPI00061A739D|nr:outer membrane protein assembly factor BamA [Blochmannia endosymbiont of Polyrhachis (Hedomyrma) turneri]AKC59858.1 Outer membrane protein assembly factor BamA [Blochmannia endosymbiont of Polyrhachis (Hedomyrma) turneri]
MKKIFLIIFISFNILLILNHTLSYADNQFIIKNIQCEGLQRVPTKLILSHVPFRTKDIINDHDIANTIKILFSTGYFENIKILKNNNTIIIRVKEYPLIANISFLGNQTIKKNILDKNLKLHGIEVGKFFNPQSISKMEEILKNFYYDIGKYNAKIQPTIIHLPNNQINLKILFDEGKTAKVQKINIIGNHQTNFNTLLKLFQLHNNIYGLHIPFKKQYKKKYLLHDLKSLQNFYLNRGFAKFNIDSTHIRLTPNKENVYISIYITEGLQYKISKISVSGNISNFSHKIHTLLKIHPNELYNNQKIQNTIYDIKKFLGTHGYINPNIITELEINDTIKTVKLYLNIDIGKRFYVNKIIFKGNTFTQDPVLRREIYQMENTWINSNFLNHSQKRLNRTGLFEYVKIHTEYIPKIPDMANIIYEVKEHNSGNMNINVGIGTESGINFQCGIQQENLFGTGNAFILNATKNHYQTYTELSITYPYLTINNLGIEGKIFYNNFTANNADLANYGLKSYGMNFSIGFPVNEYNTTNFGLDYMYNHLNNIKPQIIIWRYLNSQGIYPKTFINNKIKNKNETFHNINFTSNDLFFRIDWKHNTLNHSYFPTQGVYSDISGKITIPGSSNKYYKLSLNSTHYIPLYKKSNYWILMGHIHAGYSAGLYGHKNPFYDNFYSGGNNIVRGFRNNTIGPKAAYYICTTDNTTYDSCIIKNSQDAIGGNAITILKGELIIPPPFLSKKYINTIRTSVFIDMGTVWDTYWKNTLSTYAAAIPNYKKATNIRISDGLAIQWMSPVGPIIFSYSKLIKKYTGDKTEQFQFNIGKTW